MHHSVSGFKQGSANCHPWVQLPVFVNKVLSQHGHVHSLSYSLHLLWATRAELSSCDRDHAREPTVFTVWPCKKKFAHSWLETTMIYYFSQSWMLGNWAFLLLVSLELLKQLPSSDSLTGTEGLRQLFSGAWQWWLASYSPGTWPLSPREVIWDSSQHCGHGVLRRQEQKCKASQGPICGIHPKVAFSSPVSRSKQVTQPTQIHVLGK